MEQLMAPLTPRFRLHLRLAAIFITSALILLTLGFLEYLISGAFGSMTSAANQIDDTRSISAANSALRGLQKQLGATIRDNAYWDDAYKNVSAEGGPDWALETWGSTTANYPLYDTAIVIKADGRPMMAYHKGSAMADPYSFYKDALPEILAAARRPDPGRDKIPVAFVETLEGAAVVGAAAIQPSDVNLKSDPSQFKILLFSKQLTPPVIAEIARNYGLNGLLIKSRIDPGRLHANVEDVAGRDIAYLTWPSELPGTASYLKVRTTVISATIIFAVVLGAVAIAGFAAFRVVRAEERSSNHKAKHDALTALWNRAGLLEQLDDALGTANIVTCLHVLDLDGFKPVNDAWGHAVGDELIKAVAQRLVRHLPPEAAIARLGGDEFAVVFTRPSETDDLPTLSAEIQRALATPFQIGGRTIEIGGSVGTSLADNGDMNKDELLRRADLALYAAKDLGRGMSVDYHSSLDEDAGKNAEVEQELRHGLASGELRVAFQPLISASTGEVSGVEALARWTSPTRGPVSPDIFIGIAEKAGLIDQLGFEILKTAIDEASNWGEIGIAVNISPLQLKNPYFAGQVERVLSEAGFDPARLTIEVTEGVLIANPVQAKRVFSALRRLGVKIALDDFGCGYASIGTLREFGFDSMKIDRSLITALDHDEQGSAVLQATVALANALRLPVTAEGIETEEQAALVRLSGCDKLQGYLFSKPITASEITSRYFSSTKIPAAKAG